MSRAAAGIAAPRGVVRAVAVAAMRGGGGGGYGGGARRDREMFSVTCSSCGNDALVPFQPRGDKPVYCSDCFSKVRGSSTGGGYGGGGGGYGGGYGGGRSY